MEPADGGGGKFDGAGGRAVAADIMCCGLTGLILRVALYGASAFDG